MGVQTFPNGGLKSVQRGTVSAPATVTISAVNMNKSLVNFNSQITSSTSSNGSVYANLTSSTTLNITNSSGNSGALVAWEVVEYY